MEAGGKSAVNSVSRFSLRNGTELPEKWGDSESFKVSKFLWQCVQGLATVRKRSATVT
jgi:hypothetical protein